ncbi:MAG: TldD/PmbA family protein [Clostridiales bacterium]
MLKKDVLSKILKKAMSTGADFAEVYEEDVLSNSLSLVKGKIENIVAGRSYGVGIRLIKGLNCIYAFSNENSTESLLKVATDVAEALSDYNSKIVNSDIYLNESLNKNIHPILFMPSSYASKNKADIIKRAYSAAYDVSPLISQVSVYLGDSDKKILIANSDGLYTEDRRARVRMGITSIASENNENQVGSESPGSLKGYEYFDEIDVENHGRTASNIALTMLKAKNCPAGIMPVALENAFGGVIFHEACGHSLESTSVAKGNSVFSGKLGKKIASSKVTAIDDGTIPNAWGSVNIDDEGMPTQKNILIENGILKNYMIDKLNGKRMGMKPTGSSRRESYKYAPTSRMTNTYIAPGNDSKEDIINSINDGLYAKKLGGGSVNTITGEFNFSVMEGYIIKNGKIDEPVRGASLIGKGSEVLLNIDMVGDNLALGQGVCGASSGNIPVNVGQPLIRVSKITVGGRA